MSRSWKLAEEGFVVLSLLLFTGALLPTLYQIRTGKPAVNSVEGNLELIASFFVIYIITCFLLFIRWKKVVYAVRQRKLLLVLVALALVSAIWSAAPDITLRRSVALVGTTLFGVYLATRYTLNEQFRLLTWTLGVSMLLSIVFAFLLPFYGIHQHEFAGQWKGIYMHKNSLGLIMGFSLCVFSLLMFWGGSYRWHGRVGSGFSAMLLLLSASVTPMLSWLTVFALLPLYNTLRWRHRLKLLFFFMAFLINIIGVTLLGMNVEKILNAFGRDLTLTGRTELWSVVFEMIQRRPWLGYGYAAFWLGWDGESKYVWNFIRWQPDYSHNGYLELLLQLGLLGTIVFAIDFVLSFIRAITLAEATSNANGIFPLVFLTFFLQFSVSESAILKQNNIFWVLYVALTLSMLIQPAKTKEADT